MASSRLALGLLLAGTAAADGTGLIGAGKTMYRPPCAFACRSVIAGCPLLCTPKHDGGDAHAGHGATMTPPECYTTDSAFLRTMALCMDTYCSDNGHPSMGTLEDYWMSHIGSGSIGDYTWKPALAYGEALRLAREDERNGTKSGNHTTSAGGGSHAHRRRQISRRHGGGTESAHEEDTQTDSALPIIKAKMPLNVTSAVAYKDWLKQYNGLRGFEANEVRHSIYTIILTVVALFVPLALSLFRLIPGINRSRGWLWLNSMLIQPPLWGKHHRLPVARFLGGGIMPTRGQGLYILLISILNIGFLLFPYKVYMPQSTFETLAALETSTVGNRAGNLAMGNMVALFVFSARNNVLLWLTDWPYDTYLLLHRWLGYWTIIQTVIHSVMLYAYYVRFGGYAEESTQLYWTWGVVGTVCVAAIWPFSILAVRQRAYELFLSTHHILVVFFLVGYYYHIWYLFKYKWGYEIWAFIGIAIWGLERLARLVRVSLSGFKMATVSAVEGSEGDYIRVDIENTSARATTYLYFPTLSWRFWENHPFSITSLVAPTKLSTETEDMTADPEKAPATAAATKTVRTEASSKNTATTPRRTVTLAMRVRSGMTARLAAKVSAGGGPMRIPVFMEGSYHTAGTSQLSQCTRILCIAGGVGLTAVLPILQRHGKSRPARLCWGLRNESLKSVFRDGLDGLASTVDIETHIGARMDVLSVVREELTLSCGPEDRSPIGVVVCGPPGMADDVRQTVATVSRQYTVTRGVVFVDEAFSW